MAATKTTRGPRKVTGYIKLYQKTAGAYAKAQLAKNNLDAAWLKMNGGQQAAAKQELGQLGLIKTES